MNRNIRILNRHHYGAFRCRDRIVNRHVIAVEQLDELVSGAALSRLNKVCAIPV